MCVHGLGLHGATYADFGERVSKVGIATYAIDVRGFGSWINEKTGRRTIDFDGALSDIYTTLKVIHRLHPGLPVFLLGESMGGAIALRATALHPEIIDGLISSVPSADRYKQKQTSLRVALHFLESPHKELDVGDGVVKQATKNEELRKTWGDDPLARKDISPVELIEFQRFMNQNHKMANLIKEKPVLFVQGCEDKLVGPEGTIKLYNELKTPDRQILLIPKAEHLIFEENQFTDQDFDAVVSWMSDHLSTTKVSSQGSSPVQEANRMVGKPE